MRPQLRAILRVAAEHDNVKVMFPMVAALGELRAARAILDEERAALGIDPPLEVGIMVEVPAVAVAAERFAARGGLLLDRDERPRPVHARGRARQRARRGAARPARSRRCWRSSTRSSGGAQAHGRWVGVCGELAGDPLAAVLLVGLGVTELSMAAPRIPDVKAALRGIDAGEAAAVAREAIAADDAQAVAALAADLVQSSARATIPPS